MSQWPELEYSVSQVKKAGRILRKHEVQILAHSEDEVQWATQVLRNWRRAHAEAENWTQMGCRTRANTLVIEATVTQRLKEMPTIIGKLVRMGNRVQLSTMEDIAGARAVVPTVHELRRLEQQWLRRPTYPIERHRDYIESPRSSGYRAVHLVMRHKGRLVEVQLRTKLQNEWADLVEDLGHATGSALKNQEGPPELIANLASLADEVAVVDSAPQRYADAWRLTLERIAEVRAKVRSSKGDDDV